MTCAVCFAAWDDVVRRSCPNCQYDAFAPGAREPRTVLDARTAFRESVTRFAPETRITPWDIAKPWVSLVLACLLLVGWLYACSAVGLGGPDRPFMW